MAPPEMEVAAQHTEWCGDSDGEEEDTPSFERVATDAHAAREKRLTVGFSAMENNVVVGDMEIPQMKCVPSTKQWEALEDGDDEAGTANQFKQVASNAHAAREERLKCGLEALERAEMVGDTEEHVMQCVPSTKQWEALEDEDDEAGTANQFEKVASDAHAAREARLHIGLNALERGEMVGDTEEQVMQCVPSTKQWEALENEDEDAGTASQFKKVASDAHAAREARLKSGLNALEQGAMVGDSEEHVVQVVPPTKEWEELEDEEDEAGTAKQFKKVASDAHAAREERIKCGAEALERGALVGDSEEPLMQVMPTSKDWEELEDEEDEAGTDNQFKKVASDAYAAREQRINKGAEALEKGGVLGDAEIMEVRVVPKGKEWKELEDEEDEAIIGTRSGPS